MNNFSISARTKATASAAFIATMTGYVNIDAIIAIEQAKAERLAFTTTNAIVKLQSTAGRLNLFSPLRKRNYLVSEALPFSKIRNVSRTEDLILRRATLRAGRFIAKGRFVGK